MTSMSSKEKRKMEKTLDILWPFLYLVYVKAGFIRRISKPHSPSGSPARLDNVHGDRAGTLGFWRSVMGKHLWEIYTLSNPLTGAVRYVGVAVNAKRRLGDHLSSTKRGGKTHCYNWIRSLLESGLVPMQAVIERGMGDSWKQAERQWIALYRGTCDLTNLTDGGEGRLGYLNSPETRAKMSAAHRGKKCSPFTIEHRAKIGAGNRGKRLSPETRAKLSAAARNISLETRAKMSAAARNRSPETRAKLAAGHKGKKLSPETREKISATLKGHRCSPETRAKIGAANKRKSGHDHD